MKFFNRKEEIEDSSGKKITFEPITQILVICDGEEKIMPSPEASALYEKLRKQEAGKKFFKISL